jgi:signal transduction histidine kinase
MLRLEPWEAPHAFPGTSSMGRLTASIGSGWGSLVQRRGFWIGMWVAAAGTGLRGLADRVEALDGRLRVMSPLGGGTTVTAELPCAS